MAKCGLFPRFVDREVLRRDRRVRVRGVDAALVEQRCPREVPKDVLPFGPIQYSRTRGLSITEDVAIQYSRHAWWHSFHLFKGFGFVLLFHRFQAIRLRQVEGCSRVVGAGHLEIKNYRTN